MNNTTGDIATESAGIPNAVQTTIYSCILVLALIGNGILVTKILKKKKSISVRLIMNLAFCDVTLVTTSIPPTLTEMHLGYYPFGSVGCHLLNPLGTLAIISVSLTLVFLSFERYVAIVHPFKYSDLKNVSIVLIVLLHFISLCFVLPYALVSHVVINDGTPSCVESWSDRSSSAYTIVLFLVQYGIPLPIICMFYFLTWRRLKRSNDECIRLEENKRRLRQRRIVVDTNGNTTLQSDVKEKKKKTRSVPQSSSLYHIMKRKKQTMSMLRLFVSIVIVFAMFMLPNQITWLYITFSGGDVSDTQITVAYWLTYTNSVLNPVLYGSNSLFHKYFRKVRSLKRNYTLRKSTRGSSANAPVWSRSENETVFKLRRSSFYRRTYGFYGHVC